MDHHITREIVSDIAFYLVFANAALAFAGFLKDRAVPIVAGSVACQLWLLLYLIVEIRT